MLDVFGRRDYAIISELIEPGTRVLDLGCGEGELLAWLRDHKNVDGRGVELTGASVQKAIARESRFTRAIWNRGSTIIRSRRSITSF